MTDKENNVKLHVASSLKLNALVTNQLPSIPDDSFACQASLPENHHCLHVISDSDCPEVKSQIDSNPISETDICQPENETETQQNYQKTNGLTTNSDISVAVKDSSLQNVSLSGNCLFAEEINTTTTMGNQQSEKKESDNDTPDEQNQTCCKPPRRKSKDKSSKRISSRSDDTDFDAKEVYPFDSKCKEESEIVEPVDLEPFEIIETDDIKFIAGAGTSDVILSGSDGKLRISREIILEEPNEDSTNENETGNQEKSINDDEIGRGDKNVLETASVGEMCAITQQVSDTTMLDKLNRPNIQIPSVYEEQVQESIMTKDENKGYLLSSGIDKTEKRNSEMIVLSQDMFTNTAKIKEHVLNTEVNDDCKSEQIGNKGITEKMPEKRTDVEQNLSLNLITNDKSKDLNADTAVYENVNIKGVETLIAKQAPIQTKVPVTYILTQEMFTKESQIENQTAGTDSQYERVQTDHITHHTSTDSSVLGSQPKTESDIITASRFKDTAEEKLRLQITETVPTRNNDSINISNPTYGYDEEDSIIRGSQEENIYETVDNHANFDIGNRSKFYGNEPISKSMGANEEFKGSVKSSESCCKDNASSSLPEVKYTEYNVSENIGVPSLELPSMTAEIESSTTSKEIELDKQPFNSEAVAAISDILTDGLYATIGEPFKLSKHKSTQEGEDLSLNDSEQKDKKSNSLSKTDSLEVPPNEGTLVNSREDTVPPPSPASMNILTEENEDEEDENDHTLSNEMIDFGDVVCKRLSRLLEDQSFNEDETATTNVDQDSIIYFSPREFIDTSTGRYEMQDIEMYGKNQETVSVETETVYIGNESQDDGIEEQSIKQDSSSGTFKNSFSSQRAKVEKVGLTRNESAETLKRASGDSEKYDISKCDGSSDDDLPEYFDPDNMHKGSNKGTAQQGLDSKPNLSLQYFDDTLVQSTPNSSFVDDLTDVTPTADISREFTALPEFAKTEDRSVIQYEQTDPTTGRRSITGTESDLDVSEQRDDMSTDSMYADDEAEETMDILFTKTYTEPIEGAEVFLSCTVVNSAYKDEAKKREVWLSSDEALEYFEANASEVMSTAFMKAKKEMKDIQICLQNLRKQMDNFHGNFDDISLPDLPMSDSLSPEYHDVRRKAVTD